ncbi:MAG: polynucleotide adenylyltransferase PcnB [Kiritimatiellaeota bacterium]|nr:polynucleotide adenylyltransferase PcnB [Kiritimatiellota bacterium]
MPIIRERAKHCVSRSNIDSDALKVLRRLSDLGYTAYLVGGSVRDLLLGRTPKDFDVGTNASPTEIRGIFRNCFLIGRRFRLAHIVFGKKVIETSTFRRSPDEQDTEYGLYQSEDNTFGTPEEDAKRRDFTVNGLFYDIKTFAVIDYVDGLRDLDKRVLRSIGDPNVRFREDPVRMMRAVRFAARLGFTIDRASRKAIQKHHADILNASPPRVCEEVYRLFIGNASSTAFRLLWEFGLLNDLLPNLDAFVRASGGAKSIVWKYLAAFDSDPVSETATTGLRTAFLYYAMFKDRLVREAKQSPSEKGLSLRAAQSTLDEITNRLRIPKVAFFGAQFLLDTQRRFNEIPRRDTHTFRFVQHESFLESFALYRLVCAAEGADMAHCNTWQAFIDDKTNPRPGSGAGPKQRQERREHREGRRRGGRGRRGGGHGTAPRQPQPPTDS